MTRGFPPPPPHLGSLAYRMSKNESNKQKRFLAQHQLPRKDPFEAGPAAMWRKFVFQLAPELCFKRIVFHFFRNLAAKLVPDTRIDIWCVCVCVNNTCGGPLALSVDIAHGSYGDLGVRCAAGLR